MRAPAFQGVQRLQTEGFRGGARKDDEAKMAYTGNSSSNEVEVYLNILLKTIEKI